MGSLCYIPRALLVRAAAATEEAQGSHRASFSYDLTSRTSLLSGRSLRSAATQRFNSSTRGYACRERPQAEGLRIA